MNYTNNNQIIGAVRRNTQEQIVLYQQAKKINEEYAHYRARLLAGTCPAIMIFKDGTCETVWDDKEPVATALKLLAEYEQLAIDLLHKGR